MISIKIEMFPAENGDAFLINIENRNILIDMGYSTTYNKYIKDRLIELNNKNQSIDLLVITHIDEDHIEGAIAFFKDNGNVNSPRIIKVNEIWYNSYRNLQFDKDKVSNISKFEKGKLEEIILSNSTSNNSSRSQCENSYISVRQGSTLAGYLYGLGYSAYNWNSLFDNDCVNLDYKNEINLGDFKIFMLSPNTKKLKSLSKLWMNKLQEIDMDFQISNEILFDDAYEMFIKRIKSCDDIDEYSNISFNSESMLKILEEKILSGKKDTSISNGASISFILEYKEKKLLFLGDAHEDIIIENLEIYKEIKGNLDFEVVKLSHHGSLKNNFKWIEIIKAKKYLISTNGAKHNHPDKRVIAKILKSHNEKKVLYFNYKLDICKILNENSLKNKYNYEIIVGNENSSLEIEVFD